MHLKLHKINKNLKINNLDRFIVTYPIQSSFLHIYIYMGVLLF